MPCHIAIFISRNAFIAISSSQMSIQSTLALSCIFGYHCIFTQGLISSENVSLVCDRPGIGHYTGIRWSLKQLDQVHLYRDQVGEMIIDRDQIIKPGLGCNHFNQWIRGLCVVYIIARGFSREGFHVKIKCYLHSASHYTCLSF